LGRTLTLQKIFTLARELVWKTHCRDANFVSRSSCWFIPVLSCCYLSFIDELLFWYLMSRWASMTFMVSSGDVLMLCWCTCWHVDVSVTCECRRVAV
jgi:hypothetical protein